MIDLNTSDMDDVLRGYITALMWTTSCNGAASDRLHPSIYVDGCLGDDCDAIIGELYDYDMGSLADDALIEIRKQVATFVAAHPDDVREWIDGHDRGEWSGGQDVGYNLCLKRNSCGVGFSDRDRGELGERLDAAARELSEQDLYVGDDGKLYV